MGQADPFIEQVRADWPPGQWAREVVLVAVSGGADSVALLRALNTLRTPGQGRLLVAHFHHGIRGAAADADAEFVQRLASELGLACRMGRAVANDGTTTAAPRLASESDARQARHDFLRETAHQEAARYIALAHTADDQAETVLHRIVRGTGITGLTGIPRVRPVSIATSLVRPLLHRTRAEIVEFLARLGQPFREDESNVDPRFTRNRIRHSLLPELAAHYNPRVADALVRLAAQAAEIRDFLQQQADLLLDQVLARETSDVVELRRMPLVAAPLPVARTALATLWRRQHWPEQHLSAAHWQSLLDFIRDTTPAHDPAHPRNASPTLDLPGRVKAIHAGETITLRRHGGAD